MTFPILLFCYLLSQFYRAFLAAIAGDLARDLSLSPAELGSLPAAWLVSFALAQFPIGLALDRLGPRRTLAGFMAAAIVGAAWFALAQSYAGALAAMALIGIGCASILMAGFYLIARSYPPERFATMSSLLIGLGNLGDPLSATPLALAAARFGWRPAMLAMAVVTALAVIAALLLRDPPRETAGGGASMLGGIVETMMLRPLWPVFPLVFVGYAVVLAVRGLWISPYLETVHGLDAVTRSLAGLGMGLAMSSGTLLYVPFARLMGSPRAAVIAGLPATVLLFVALALVGSASAILACALLMAIGVTAMCYGMLMAHARLFMPAHLLGRGMTFLNFLFMAGAGTAQWSSGRLIEGTLSAGWSPASAFGALFLCFAAALAASLGVYAAASPKPDPKA